MRPLLTGGLPIALLLGGCGASAESAASHEPSTCEQRAGTPSSVVVPGDAHLARRLRCEFSAGETTKETVGSSLPRPPIDHVVVLMMGNRSFDHLFSDLSAVGVDADVAGDVSNPTGDGSSVVRYHETQYCFGAFDSPSHEWSDAHVAHAAGRMDGFVAGSGKLGPPPVRLTATRPSAAQPPRRGWRAVVRAKWFALGARRWRRWSGRPSIRA